MSKCHIVGNHMSRLICGLFLQTGEGTPGITGWLEVTVGGKLVHSKKVCSLRALLKGNVSPHTATEMVDKIFSLAIISLLIISPESKAHR